MEGRHKKSIRHTDFELISFFANENKYRALKFRVGTLHKHQTVDWVHLRPRVSLADASTQTRQ